MVYRLYFLSLFFFLYSSVFCSSFLLEEITFKSDIFFDKSEFLYLTGLQEKTFISKNDLKNAKESLLKKGRFLDVEFQVSDLHKGKQVHFVLTSNWILKKVVLHGILFGRHNYLSLYKQDSGDVFSAFLHEKNMQDIKDFLQNKGYFNFSVLDELIYNKKDKSILVKIFIKKKMRFFIRDIKFNILGEETIDLKENKLFIKRLNSKIGLKLQKKYYSKKTLDKFLRKIKSFFRKKGFPHSKIFIKKLIIKRDENIDLIFNINLGKRHNLRFIGNKLFTDKQIRQDLLGKDYPAWFFTPEIVAHELFEYYYKKGYWNALIFYKKQDERTFLFEIKENDPVVVDELIIQDENGRKNEELLIFFNKLINKVFDEDLLDKVIDKITKFNLEQGYWNFSVLDKKFIKNKKNKSCKIFIMIRSGKQRYWNGLDIKNFDYLKENEIFSKYVDFSNLEPFNFYILQQQKLFLLKYFQKKGYWYVDVYPELRQDLLDDNRVKVFVDWNVDLGPLVKFGKVFLTGNSSLSFNKILKELSFKQGEAWDRRKIDLSIKNLKKLDVFKKFLIAPDQEDLTQRSGNIPVRVTLIDDDPIQAAFRLGYFLTNKNFLFKQASTFKAGASLILKNPTNQLDKLTFNIDFTRFERKFDLDYKILSPFGLKFKNSRLVGKFKAYSNKYIHPVQVMQSGSAYESVESGFFTGLNNEYKKDYFWRLNLGNEWIRTSKVRGDLNFNQNYVNKTLPYFFLNPSFVIEKIDNDLDIKNGSISFFSFKFMIPEYTGKPTGKLTIEQSVFKPIYKDTLIAARLRMGYILKSEFNEIQPSQRFYLGGPYSVRGYDKDVIPPYGVQEIDDVKEYTIQGGSGMINANLELRFPLYKSLRGVIFQDIGALSQTGFAGFKGRWFPSSGFGFRYKTPIGPIRFDIGFKWKHLLPNDTFYTWYLTLGEVF
ncbi:MAG: BamA/TamA family outer membrane protein [bacterium]